MKDSSELIDLYICSTVRHLLFSVMRALTCPEQSAHIVLFYDYQDVDAQLLDLNALPDWIQVHLLSRRATSQLQSQSFRGRVGYFLGMRNLQTPRNWRRHFCQQLGQLSPPLSRALLSQPLKDLILFNTRNKMSRLFSCISRDYLMMEDGEANYIRAKIRGPKRFIRLLMGRPVGYRLFGEEPRCKGIYLLSPEHVPEPLRPKTRPMSFFQVSDCSQVLLKLFKVPATDTGGQRTLVLLTQPIETLAGGSDPLKTSLYELLTRELHRLGFRILLKIHPRERPEQYQHLAPWVTPLDGKIPIEALMLGSSHKVTLVSLTSSAGMGFEPWCRRIRLVDGDLGEKLTQWGDQTQPWLSLLRDKLDHHSGQAPSA